jgi:lipid A disaccharide synthetase
VPEFLQDRFRPEAVAQTALELLDNVARRDMMRRRVTELVATLGGPGASRRAAEAILLEAALAKAK